MCHAHEEQTGLHKEEKIDNTSNNFIKDGLYAHTRVHIHTHLCAYLFTHALRSLAHTHTCNNILTPKYTIFISYTKQLSLHDIYLHNIPFVK